MSGPLSFGVDAGRPTDRYGAYYWLVGLVDGREASLHADRIEVTATGALIAWRETSPVRHERTGEVEGYTPAPSELLLALAPGTWLHAYAASVLDGAPVCVEELAAP